MHQTILRTIMLALVAALLAIAGAGSAPPATGTIPLHLTSPRPRFAPLVSPAGETVGQSAALPGFGTTSRPGEPAIPLKVLLVAIPEGVDPELYIVAARSHVVDDLDLAPAPRLRVADRAARDLRGAATGHRSSASAAPSGGNGIRRDYRADGPAYLRDADLPDAPVRLGTIGYLRQQRFVEVIYTPLLYNPARRQGRHFAEIRAEIRYAVEDMQPAAVALSPDPLFESTYEASLFNYEQGRQFRVSPSPSAVMTGASAAGAERADAGERAPESTYVPGVPRYKILVSQAAVYRMDQAYLTVQAPALVGDPSFNDPRTWIVEAEGVEVPISIRNAAGGSGEADGTFDPGDFVEFYGRPKDGPDTVLHLELPGIVPDIYQHLDFTDTQVYWLTSVAPGGGHLRVPETDGAPAVPGFTLAADFQESLVWEENDIYIPIGDAEPYFSLPSLRADSVADQRDVDLAVPGIAPVTASGSLTVRLRGGTDVVEDPDHRTQVWVNADTGGGIDVSWDGEMILEESFAVDQSTLSDPTTVHLLAPGLSGVSTDRQYIDTITLDYRRTFAALGDLLLFSYPNQDVRFEIGNLGSVEPSIFEITALLAGSSEADPVRITGATPGGAPTSTWSFEVAEETGPSPPAVRTFVVAGPAALRTPDAVLLAADPVLTTSDAAADYIVIAARDAVDDAPGGALDGLFAHRLATQGLTSRLVYIDQVYDEFSYGLRDPGSIPAFLAYAYANWRGPSGTEPPPAFVLLVGDATFDYKNTLSRGDWIDQVPTPILFQQSSIIGYHSSDNLSASFLGADQIPDIHLGRISTRTPAESAAVFDKIVQYETSVSGGSWRGRAILTAGDGKFTGEADQFEAVNIGLETTYFSAPPFSAPAPPLYYENPPWNETDAIGFKADLTAEINAGAAFYTYLGHGNFDTFGLDTLFTSNDAAALTNGLQLPLMLNVNCLSGGFHFLLPEGSLGEGMLRNPGGGAIAVVAPAGLSNAFVGRVLADGIFSALLGPRRERQFGPVVSEVRTTLWGIGAVIDAQSYTYLGDPAGVLATPAPAPPGSLAATAGNDEVTLDWTAPPGSVAGVRIYRALSDPFGPYEAVSCTPLTATSCRDESAVNATRHYYYAVSYDNDGFEGAASNLNSDCDGGPDCVTALPLNPGPPAPPTGLVAVDAGTGGTLDIAWDAGPESDIDFYTLSYGVQSGIYTTTVTLPAAATAEKLTGLIDGTRYYLVLTATNTSGHESGPSDETSAVPHLVQGIGPPRVISDLAVELNGPDVVLSWSRPLLDIYDRPTNVVEYRIYRGATPGFQPSPPNLLATILDGAITTFSDVDAGNDSNTAFYLVVAVDDAGLTSGAGRDLPGGIGDLAVTLADPDLVHLEWSAVVTDMSGFPTIISHYDVHSSPVPIGRAGLGPGTLALDNVTTLSVDLPLPSNPGYLSVIAVDNRGNLSPF
jgi:hypothetical protein